MNDQEPVAGAVPASQMSNPRFAWLNEINERALQARPCIQPGYERRPVSVHDRRFAELSMSHPYYGFVATSVAGVDVLMYSANDDAVARLYFYYGPDAYETLSLRIWRRLCERASCIFDVGAFTGLYSLVARAANKLCEVIAFEPIPHIRHRAVMNVLLNGYTGTIEVEPYALSDTARMMPAYTWLGPTMLDDGSSVVPRAGATPTATDWVQAVTLDQYATGRIGQRPDLLKVKAGGHEAAVLAGGRLLLEQVRPTILIEVSNTRTLPDVIGLLRGIDYRVFSIDERQDRPHQHSGELSISKHDVLSDVHTLVACPDDVTMEIVKAGVL